MSGGAFVRGIMSGEIMSGGIMSVSLVDAAKFFLTSTLITLQNLVVVSHSVCAHVGSPQNFVGTLRPRPLEIGGVDDPMKTC